MTDGDDRGKVEAADARLNVMARVVGLDIPAACRAGVLVNLALLDSHAATLAEFVQDEALTPAPKFHP